MLVKLTPDRISYLSSPMTQYDIFLLFRIVLGLIWWTCLESILLTIPNLYYDPKKVRLFYKREKLSALYYNDLSFWSTIFGVIETLAISANGRSKNGNNKKWLYLMASKKEKNMNEFAFTFKYILRSRDVYISTFNAFTLVEKKITEKLTTLACRCSKRQLNILLFFL